MIATLLDRWLGRTDTHPGADNEWADLLAGLTDTPGRHRADNADTQVLRLPIGAIAAQPEYVIDDLGPWKPWEHEPVEPWLFTTIPAVNGVNEGSGQ